MSHFVADVLVGLVVLVDVVGLVVVPVGVVVPVLEVGVEVVGDVLVDERRRRNSSSLLFVPEPPPPPHAASVEAQMIAAAIFDIMKISALRTLEPRFSGCVVVG